MIGVIATLRVRDGKADEFESLFRGLAESVRANEPGNLVYQLTRSRNEPNMYKVLEVYRDEASLDAHRQTEHFKAAAQLLGAVLDGRPDVEVLDAIA